MEKYEISNYQMTFAQSAYVNILRLASAHAIYYGRLLHVHLLLGYNWNGLCLSIALLRWLRNIYLLKDSFFAVSIWEIYGPLYINKSIKIGSRISSIVNAINEAITVTPTVCNCDRKRY